MSTPDSGITVVIDNPKSRNRLVPVILSGGAGTRLWPLSRAGRPKQCLSLDDGPTLFQRTVLRATGAGLRLPLVVCTDDHRFLVAEQFRELGQAPAAIVLEPEGRNTAPAIAAAALVALKQNPKALLLVLPSDHLIGDDKAFGKAVGVAAAAAAAGHLVTFGVRPTAPATGYGYIMRGGPVAGCAGCFRVERFVEKPDAAAAAKYVKDGASWNSGMFVFRADRYLDELTKHRPAVAQACRQAVAAGKSDMDFIRLGIDDYCACESVSADYAVIERTDAAVVVPVDIGWNDVGTWTALHDAGKADADGNVTVGDVMVHDAKGSYVHSEKPFVAAVGVEDLLIVATDDAVLVASRDSAQNVRAVADWLRARGRSEADTASRVYRPWGYYQIIDSGDKFQAKQLMLKSGAKLSLQRHRHRAEHWVVVEGTATVTRGADTFTLEANQSTYIPVGVDHRLENRSKKPLRLIEVQSGDYLGEDDIIRLDDVYGRS